MATVESVSSTQQLDLTANATTVLERRYLKKDDEGRPLEKPADMFRRVAHNIASAERHYGASDSEVKQWEQRFYELMTALEFLPNSPTLMNAGRPFQQLSACFVLPIDDSMESIFEAVKNTALIHKSGGGKQGGTRRGANMAVLRVDHPDILEFIASKSNSDRLNNFNISVAVNDEFMQAVLNEETYDLINPRTGETVDTLSARDVFDTITEAAWANGDPGIIFLDRINADNPTPELGDVESTNPCGEQPLLPYESCNLGSINLNKMVIGDIGEGEIDWDKLGATVAAAVRFLDNVIEMNKFPLAKIEQMTEANRKIGLGVMGFADMLIHLGIPYASEPAAKMAKEVMSFIEERAQQASVQLAEQRGVFPNWGTSVYNRDGNGRRLRNATVTTIAPTGSISIIAGSSSGIEPLFAVAYTRHVLDGEELVEVNPLFEQVAQERGFYSPELIKTIAAKGSLQEIEEIPADVREVFLTAHDIAPEWHIRIQAAFQEATDNAVSKTVNFANDATVEDVAEVYMLAYELGCKGVTMYRDGSRESQVLTTGKTEEAREGQRLAPRPRPDAVTGVTRNMTTGCGKLYVTINFDKADEAFEVFGNMGKAGGCVASQTEAMARLISLALRSGIGPEHIVKQLKGISCHMPAWESGGGKILSCADAFAKALERTVLSEDVQLSIDFKGPSFGHAGACPDCGGPLYYEGGCLTCHDCGYSQCE